MVVLTTRDWQEHRNGERERQKNTKNKTNKCTMIDTETGKHTLGHKCTMREKNIHKYRWSGTQSYNDRHRERG